MATLIKVKRKRSTGNGNMIVNSGEPFYNMADKHFYIGNKENESVSSKKHIAEITNLSSAADTISFQIGEDAKNKFEKKIEIDLSSVGNAETAKKLNPGATIITDLSSKTATLFDGSKNIEIGVKGKLPASMVDGLDDIIGDAIGGSAYTHPDVGTPGTYGPTSGSSLKFGGTFDVPYVTTNTQGHVSAAGKSTFTIPKNVVSKTEDGLMSSDLLSRLEDLEEALKKIQGGLGVSNFTVDDLRKHLTADAPLEYKQGSGSTKDSIAHKKSGVTANTYGSSTLIPSIKVDEFGHITSVSTVSVSDTKVNVKSSTDDHAYLLGITTSPSSTATAKEAVANSAVYAKFDEDNVSLVAPKFYERRENSSGGMSLAKLSFIQYGTATANNFSNGYKPQKGDIYIQI